MKNLRKKSFISSSGQSMQVMIAVSFSIIFIAIIIILSIILYELFSDRTEETVQNNASVYLNQTKSSIEEYLRSMRRISDSLYYSEIKKDDTDKTSYDEAFNLVYESQADNLVSIALYSEDGSLVTAVPVSTEKSDVRGQEWFTEALDTLENIHFSIPHVQNLFDEGIGEYHWVISLSRAVELNNDGVPGQGVLLVDMDFGSFKTTLDKANNDESSNYVYLCDADGNIIYHPKQMLINAGLLDENNEETAGLFDGSYKEVFNGEERITVIKTVGYTGWKLVMVIPKEGYAVGLDRMQYLVALIICLFMFGVIVVSEIVSLEITSPLMRLDRSVKDLETGNLHPNIYIGGSSEVEHLGKTLESSVATINNLMDDVLAEQEEKRKSELDALQSQINPHFLYNALDSVVWMIEDNQPDGAVKMVNELASLMRISISHGKTIIPVRNEIQHARSYMSIQEIRFKNTFSIDFDIAEEILDCCTVKLIVQPILENAIYYGVQALEDEGEIHVKGYRDGDDVYIDVMDNGIGMTEEQVKRLLLTDEEKKSLGETKNPSSRHGNGVGLINVHQRIKLYFGNEYGLEITSEPDEGTTVRIHLPYKQYREDNDNG